jgi:hypothetical protein
MKYSALEPRPELEASELFNLAVLKTPTKLTEAMSTLSQLEDRLEARRDLFSSPTNRVINSTIRGTKAVLIASELTERELEILMQRVQAQLNAWSSGSNRAVLQKGGHLAGNKAKAVKAKKQKEHIAKEGNRKTKTYSATWNRVYKVYREAGVAARKTERKRINILKTGNIDPELLIPIPDPEKEVTVAQINL